MLLLFRACVLHQHLTPMLKGFLKAANLRVDGLDLKTEYPDIDSLCGLAFEEQTLIRRNSPRNRSLVGREVRDI